MQIQHFLLKNKILPTYLPNVGHVVKRIALEQSRDCANVLRNLGISCATQSPDYANICMCKDQYLQREKFVFITLQ